MPRPAKRARPVSTATGGLPNQESVSTGHTLAVPDDIDIVAAIDDLDREALSGILKVLVSHVPEARDLVKTSHREKEELRRRAEEAEKARVIDLSSYSGSAWYVLNKKYKSSSGSREYDSAYDAYEEVVEIIDSIIDQTQPSASYGTKRSAMETLRKIGKSVVLAPSTLGSEVRKQMCYDPNLAEGMLSIAQSMSLAERARLGQEADEKGTFLTKPTDLANSASGYCIFDGLDEVIKMFRSDGNGGNDANAIVIDD